MNEIDASLKVVIEKSVDGWTVWAPWLESPLVGETWEDLYKEAMRLRPR